MAEIVYVLCAVTSITCAFMLWRGYKRGGSRLLFWSCLCFVGLALNNVLLFVDLVVVPGIALGIMRSIIALVAMFVLILGLVWETK